MPALLDRLGNPVNRGDRLVDAHGGVWLVTSLGGVKAHCISPGGERVRVDTKRFVKIAAHKRAELPTAGERRKWYFQKMQWE